jgi:protein involved in polysaccharide export with SLBB domain
MKKYHPSLLHTAALLLCGGFFLRCHAQDSAAQEKPAMNSAASVVAGTNSMDVLDDKRKIGPGDRVSYRVVEERKQPVSLFVTDSGEIEVPLIGRIPATGKTCKQLALDIREPLEKEYFYKATVIIGLDFVSGKSHGRVYLTGSLARQGPLDIPPDEVFTVSKAILRAGGFDQFANKRKVKLVRKKADNPAANETIIVDVEDVLDHGHTENDPVVSPDDMIIVPKKWINY